MTWHEELDQQGYAVVPGVVPEFEELRERLWQDLSELVPEFRLDGTLEQKKALYKMSPLHSMLYQHFVGHLQSVWDVRQHEGVNRVFREIWGVDDLYTSFDGISALVAPEDTKRGFSRGHDWMHVDQNPRKLGRTSVQGYVTLYDAGPQDATLQVVPRSHLEDRSALEAAGDWLLMPGRLADSVRVEARAGDLVLWDSRLVHQGGQPLRERVRRPESEHRLVVYVCQFPRCAVARDDIHWGGLTSALVTKRGKIFRDLRMTNHWGTKMFAKTPRAYNPHESANFYQFTKRIKPPTLTDLGRSLL